MSSVKQTQNFLGNSWDPWELLSVDLNVNAFTFKSGEEFCTELNHRQREKYSKSVDSGAGSERKDVSAVQVGIYLYV